MSRGINNNKNQHLNKIKSKDNRINAMKTDIYEEKQNNAKPHQLSKRHKSENNHSK